MTKLVLCIVAFAVALAGAPAGDDVVATARADRKVDWSEYIETQPSRTLRAPAKAKRGSKKLSKKQPKKLSKKRFAKKQKAKKRGGSKRRR